MLVDIFLSALSDTAIFDGDMIMASKEVARSMSKAGNSSASATITITMTGMLNE